MSSSSRSSAPPPLHLGSAQAMNSPPTSPSSDGSESRSYVSEDYLLGMMATRRSTTTDHKAAAAARVKSPRKVNANSYCGRHSDEFLFGPHGFGDLWRSITSKKDH
ncbi:hypothetical protein QBC47DRAFT_417110 [Echria macrotheca]|uniref:Uncharacterized protein n=1 Tax=Echria macrotheca TaxID=438768 RepID=A0AAJ0B617_9PEZI|nr:hypothetical protein QBC47DRAFT_417110 [Echria macrotheca]